MTKIAFIGLGIMGGPMAVHLANAGHEVAGFNRSPEKAKPLVDAGATVIVHGRDATKAARTAAEIASATGALTHSRTFDVTEAADVGTEVCAYGTAVVLARE